MLEGRLLAPVVRVSRHEEPVRVRPVAYASAAVEGVCGEFVFVQQSAEAVATAEAVEPQRVIARRRFVYRRLRERRLLTERAVWPVFVVVRRVDVDHAFEVTSADN